MESAAETENKTEEIKKGTSERALLAAVEMLSRWLAERDTLPLDRIMDSEFRGRRYLNSGERRWIGEAIYGVVRHFTRQKTLLAALNLPETAANLIRSWADAPADPEISPAQFPQTAPLADWESWQKALASLPLPDSPADYLRVALSFPDALAAELERLLGAEAIAAARAFNRPAPVTLRVNTLKASRERALRDLPEAVPTAYSAVGITLPKRVNLPSLPGFREGRFEAQEEASQMMARLAGPEPGQNVVDVGAGAGGKTLPLAALMENKGRLVALDIALPRLEELQDRAHRAGVSKMEIIELEANAEGVWRRDGEARKVLLGLNGTADHVLLDASGSGVIRRAPDTKWRAADISAFARLQTVLLEQASELVKPGGTLCYATCAIEAAQNEQIIESFLAGATGQNFEVAPLSPEFAPFAEGPFFRSWPHRHTMDAFFASKIRRKGIGVRG